MSMQLSHKLDVFLCLSFCRMALLIESCSSCFHINCKTFFSVLCIEMKSVAVFKRNSPQVIIKSANVWSGEFGGHSPLPLQLMATLPCEQVHGPAGK